MRHRIRYLTVVFLISNLFAALRTEAQGSSSPQPPADQLQRAAALFAQTDWKATYDAYNALATAFPMHALSRFRVGVSLMELNKLPEAEKNLREGERLGIPVAQAAFRLSQVLTEEGRADAAIGELQRAVGAGLPLAPSALETDRHLAKLKTHPKWPAVMDALDAVIRPCMHDARFREFDFWVGDWDVRPTGQPPVGPAARNTVTIEDNGCVVMEHWKSPSGSEGQSFNIFDRSVGVWRQTWVDNVGGQHDYRGSAEHGNMLFVGDTPAPNGQRGRVPTKLTFFHIAKDSVRQYSEISSDSGRTWQPNYDLMYVRRKDSVAAAQLPNRQGPPHHAGVPSVSPDGRHVLFFVDWGGRPQPHIIDADGTNQHALPPLPIVSMSWLPEGKRILTIQATDRASPRHLVVMNPDGTDPHEIPVIGLLAFAMPLGDASSVLVGSWDPGADPSSTPPQLHIVRTDGSVARTVAIPAVPGRLSAIRPSRDGRRVAFVTAIRDSADASPFAVKSSTLYVMNIDGSSLKALATFPNLVEQPSWTYDGGRIAVQNDLPHPHDATGRPLDPNAVDGDIVVIDVTLGTTRELKHSGRKYLDEVPDWSSDGRLYVQSNRDGVLDIYRMDADGSHPLRLTK